MGRLSTIYESILLFEGRIEKARERYPMINDIVFNHYVNADPSGNQKYLDWMLGTTLSDSPNFQNDDSFDPNTFERGSNVVLRPDKRPIQYHIDMINAVEFFHQNQQRFEKKDINQYKSLSELEDNIKVVEKKIQQRELEKDAKRDRDILYKDGRWLVVVPKSHEASCKYGAGTKWCVTMKDDSTYWNRYSKNAMFFFIFDKTKDEKDPLYKVAYRIKGSSGEKYELWDATDREFALRNSGQDYMDSLPGPLKERISIYHAQNYVGGEVSDDPGAQAIVNYTGVEGIQSIEDSYYGMEIYEDEDGDFWVAGSEGDMDDAVRDRFEDMDDDELQEIYDYEGDYLYLHDEDDFAEQEADNYLDGVSEGDVLAYSGKEDEYYDAQNRLEELQNEEDYGEDEESDLIREMETILEDAHELAHEIYKEEVLDCLSGGHIGCLVNNYGWFRNAREAWKSGMFYLERDDLIDSVIGWGSDSYDMIAYYGWDRVEDDEGNEWIVFQIDY
jgi:hypothetical protein